MGSGSLYSGRIRVRACGLIIRNESILLVKQNVPTRNEPIWLPPGGGVNLTETVSDTLVREVFEETRLRISGFRLRYIHEFIQPPFHAVEFYYLVSNFGGHVRTGHDPELAGSNQDILDVQFAPFKYMKSWNVHPRFLIEEITDRRIMNHDVTQFKTVRNEL